ncbi:hypothetical protein QQF64_025063 [Cirrhinus molitorella]|uniref:Uncharacterized protein n=1 Tax=Cirrhinus molitorella TaxID=172907 RepID=A0ABR3NNB7_9TELE
MTERERERESSWGILDEQRREGEEVGGEGGWKGEGVCVCVWKRENHRETEREATDGRGGSRRKSHSERISKATVWERQIHRHRKNREEDGVRGQHLPNQ